MANLSISYATVGMVAPFVLAVERLVHGEAWLAASAGAVGMLSVGLRGPGFW